MKKFISLLVLLALVSLACSLTAPPSGTTVSGLFALPAQFTPTPEPVPTPAPAHTLTPTPAPRLDSCYVRTGFKNGRVNLRTCAGLACSVVKVLSEGDRLTVITSGDWLQVQTGSLNGYVNALYCQVTP